VCNQQPYQPHPALLHLAGRHTVRHGAHTVCADCCTGVHLALACVRGPLRLIVQVLCLCMLLRCRAACGTYGSDDCIGDKTPSVLHRIEGWGCGWPGRQHACSSKALQHVVPVPTVLLFGLADWLHSCTWLQPTVLLCSHCWCLSVGCLLSVEVFVCAPKQACNTGLLLRRCLGCWRLQALE
jgi:hypothetical protein